MHGSVCAMGFARKIGFSLSRMSPSLLASVGNDPTHGRSTGAVGSCTYWNSHAQMIRRMTGRLGQTHTRLNGTPSTSSQLDDSHSTGCLLQLMNRSFALATSPVAATSTVATYIPESRRASQRDSLRDIYGFDLSSPSVPHHEFEIQL